MATRLTQLSREVLQSGGNPNARVTQLSREVLQSGGNPNARVTQLSREVLVRLNVIPSSVAITAPAPSFSGVAVEKDIPSGGIIAPHPTLSGSGIEKFKASSTFTQVVNTFEIDVVNNSFFFVSGGISQGSSSIGSTAVEKLVSSGGIIQYSTPIEISAKDFLLASGGILVTNSIKIIAFQPYGDLPPSRIYVVNRDGRIVIISKDNRVLMVSRG